jgi:hypothetical protein
MGIYDVPSSTLMAAGRWPTGSPTTHRPPCRGKRVLRETVSVDGVSIHSSVLIGDSAG